jgi:hypothetical protein
MIWREANSRYLGATLEELYVRLQLYLAKVDDDGEPLHQGADHAVGEAGRHVQAAEALLPSSSALHRVCESLDLSEFERSLLLLCAAGELDARFPPLYAMAQTESKPYVTFSLALALYRPAEWDALAPTSPLRFWRLIELGPGTALTTAPLRIDERILHYLAGANTLDERLPLMTAGEQDERLLAGEEIAVAQLVGSTLASGDCNVLQLHGNDREQRRRNVQAACDAAGFDLEVMSAAALPHAPVDLTNLIRLWNREVLLGDYVLLLDYEEGSEPSRGTERALERFVTETQGLTVISARERILFGDVPMLFFESALPGAESQTKEWEQSLGSAFEGMEDSIDRLVGQFNVNLHTIHAASSALRASEDVVATSPERRGAWLWEFCRTQARSRLHGLAQRVESTASWDDLILPEMQRQMLEEIALQVRHRTAVYKHWGFGELSSRGQGITVLFAGTSGTGKTLAAEVLANELHLDLYRIDLSAVVSKYIGETEKSLRKVFDAAEAGGAILLFDEADALFGKRSEVKDSHDRHANIEVSFLLQKMEAYRGMAVLTSNLKQSLDAAFLRRLRFVVDFPFPAAEERMKIWQRSIPAKAPTEGIDLMKLSRLNMSGGNIRNISLSAAFLAASEGGPIRMKHLLQAARAEGMKLEKNISDAETRDWL